MSDPIAIYHFDAGTKEYVESSQSRIDPLDRTPMIPANATDQEPPVPGDNQAAVFDGDNWAMVPDHRGEVYYETDGSKHIITALGVEPDSEWVSTKPEAPVDLSKEIKNIRDTKITAGISLGPIEVITDNITQQRLIAVRVKAESDPDFTVNWKTSNGFMMLDAATIISLSDAVLAHVQAAFDAESSLDISNYQTVAELQTAFDVAYNSAIGA